jgi:hypothetical protein
MGKVSKSKIYGILKRIYQMGWVHRDYEEDEQARRNSIKMDWAGIWVEEEYDHLVVNKEKRFMTERLFPVFLEYIRKAMDDMREDKTAKKWLPEKDYCKTCRTSHEAHEFFTSLLDIATSEFLDSKEFLKFQKELGFSEQSKIE